jgi:hypothetical protein
MKYQFFVAVRNVWGDTNEFRICSFEYENEIDAKQEAERLNALGRHEYKVIRKIKEK